MSNEGLLSLSDDVLWLVLRIEFKERIGYIPYLGYRVGCTGWTTGTWTNKRVNELSLINQRLRKLLNNKRMWHTHSVRGWDFKPGSFNV